MLDIESEASLKRNLSKAMVLFYGLGTILGAGVYVLIGKVAETAGLYTPFSFIIASFIALFTAVSYAELSARFPKSAGEAYYVFKAFNLSWLSQLVGWMVVLTGIVSAAAITKGFSGYLQVIVTIPSWVCIVCLVCAMAFIAFWGIRESVWLLMGITLIEVLGLLLIIGLSFGDFDRIPALYHNAPPLDYAILGGIFSGAFLAFYAYIGFEDMVNVAEEVKHPEKTLPPAIFWALAIASTLYFLVALAMIVSLPLDSLAKSDAPLADFFQVKGYSPALITWISLVAIVNGALAQIIMASRVIYGMARENHAPKFLGHVNVYRHTPDVATGIVSLVILILALGFRIEWLANLTSTIILGVFIMIHLALIQMKLTQSESSPPPVSYPLFFPVVGVVLTSLFLLGKYL